MSHEIVYMLRREFSIPESNQLFSFFHIFNVTSIDFCFTLDPEMDQLPAQKIKEKLPYLWGV